MPIVIPNNLPATEVLKGENIFVMNESRASTQQIRPLEILLLNLMPKKIETETQIARLIGNTPIQVHLNLLIPTSHHPKNTPMEHLIAFYNTFDELKDKKFDGMIITGAPVELLDFDEVEYWDELCEMMEWSKTHVTSTMHICWGAQAGLYYHYGVPKVEMPRKLFGVFHHKLEARFSPLFRGFDDVFSVPHSRYTTVRREDLEKVPELDILVSSKDAGVYACATHDLDQVFLMGHAEYDEHTLNAEYHRDLEKGLDINVPKNYYEGDDPENSTYVTWRSCATLLFSNWINHVYQDTPFDLKDVKNEDRPRFTY